MTKSLTRILQLPIYLILSLWLVHICKLAFNLPLGNYGLVPRDASGAIGILTSPFIHGNWEHLASNSVPLFVLTMIILIFYKRVAFKSIFLIYIITGAAVWLFGRHVIHIGASGVVYGLVSFVFWSGIFRRNIKSIILALIVTILYSGLFLGILPTQDGISWESHLCGGIVGIFVAYIMKDELSPDEIERDPWADDAGNERHYLPRDAFDVTKIERAHRRLEGE